MASVEEEQPKVLNDDEANKLISQGQRHFVCNEIAKAVKCFENACMILNKKYGTLANECGDAHFYYGKCLLELARLESGVLGSALKEDVEDELSDSDDEQNVENGGEASGESSTMKVENVTQEDVNKSEVNDENSCVKNEKTESEDAKKVDTIDGKVDDIETEKKVKNEPVSDDQCKSEENEKKIEEKSVDDGECSKESNDDNDMDAASEGTEQDVKEIVKKDIADNSHEEKGKEDLSREEKEKDEHVKDNEDEKRTEEKLKNEDETSDDGPVTTIQLAWETLELARIIFRRHNNSEMQLKLAQAHLLLGEIHMEQEQFQDAISELIKCLNIQKNLLQPDDRLLAETYYNLGLAYGFSMMFEESSHHYGNACEVLELRIKNIKTRVSKIEEEDKGKEKVSHDEPLMKDRKELTELEQLLPEIKDKCNETKNEVEQLKSNIKEKLGLSQFQSRVEPSSDINTSSDKPVNDISHLVRKKRKPKDEETLESSEVANKKPRKENDSPDASKNDETTQ